MLVYGIWSCNSHIAQFEVADEREARVCYWERQQHARLQHGQYFLGRSSDTQASTGTKFRANHAFDMVAIQFGHEKCVPRVSQLIEYV